MAKFKNKKNNKIIEEKLSFYIERLRNNPNYEEVKEKKISKNKDNPTNVENIDNFNKIMVDEKTLSEDIKEENIIPQK